MNEDKIVKLAKRATLAGMAGLAILFAVVVALTACTTPHSAESHGNAEVATASHCGIERWSVKTGTDVQSSAIDTTQPTQTTIAQLTGYPKPGILPPDSRLSPVETTDFTLMATLVEYKIEADSDIHMVIKDPFGNHMIAELPDPNCVGSMSPWGQQIAAARLAFDTRFNPTTSWQSANQTIQITGIGFFDSIHGQTGVAQNGVEIHPVLSVKF